MSILSDTKATPITVRKTEVKKILINLTLNEVSKLRIFLQYTKRSLQN